MNTKLFLLLVCLLTTNHTSSIVIKGVVSSPAAIVAQVSSSSANLKENATTIDLTLPDQAPDHAPKHAENGPKEHEDGKHHNFHFSRVPASKCRNLIVIAGKFALAILHVCVFIYCFMHVFH